MEQKVAIDFLIQCHFGYIDDLILSAIDRAYIDMQTHTVEGDKESLLFPKRKEITEYLYHQIQHLPNQQNYDDWHETTSEAIKEKYNQLSYGQIQKWINMTVKYLCTFRLLGFETVDEYFGKKENYMWFHAPLDSYVLNGIGMCDLSWSKDIKSYEIYKKIAYEMSFIDEYKNWPAYAKYANMTKSGKEKKADKGTYKRYIQEHPYDFK